MKRHAGESERHGGPWWMGLIKDSMVPGHGQWFLKMLYIYKLKQQCTIIHVSDRSSLF